MPSFRRILLLVLIASIVASASAEEPLPAGEPEPLADNPYRRSILPLSPMDRAGLDYDLTNVLRNYYKQNFTNAQHWDALESIRFEGILQLPQGVIRFTAFKKKPDYSKVVFFDSKGGRFVMAYDGHDAWQLNTIQPKTSPPASPGSPDTATSVPDPVAMPEMEARNFIRDATTSGHLMYPLIAGKQVELIGAAQVDGERCHEIRVTLPDGQVIRFFLDMTDFSERRKITVNNVSGSEEVFTYSDFRRLDGIRMPFISTLTINGEQVHQSRLHSVETNLGVVPWMFSRPSGAYIPGANADPSLDFAATLNSESAGRLSGSLTTDFTFTTPPDPSKAGSLTPNQRESDFHIDPDLLQPGEIEAILREAGIPVATEAAL